MSNKNILQLPVAIGLDGSEYIVLVQGGTTKRVAVGVLETFTESAGDQSANVVFAGPASGGVGGPSFRALVDADLPVVSASKGGTGQSSYVIGDILYASTTTALSKLADIATGNALISGGVGVAPSYGKIGLTTHVTGILPVANGGTGNSALAALTRVDDTNVTLTLGGSASTALVNAASITAGWTGQLSIARGGTSGATAAAGFDALAPTTTRGDLIARGASSNGRLAIGTSGYHLQSDGTDPAWAGFVQGGTGAATLTWQNKARQIIETDDFSGATAADKILAAVTYAKTLTAPHLVLSRGNHDIGTTAVEFDLPANSTLEWLGTITSSISSGTAVRIGSTADNTFGLTVIGGVKVFRSTIAAVVGSTGVELRNLVWSYVDIRRVTGFGINLTCYGDRTNGGVSYNEIRLGQLHDGVINLYLGAGTSVGGSNAGNGYCNENNFYGGSFNHSSSWPAATASVNLEISHFASNTLNNNRFWGPCFEDNQTATYARAANVDGVYNVIYWPRMENPADQAGYQIVFGANSSLNAVTGGGFTLSNSNISDVTNANSFETIEGLYYKKPVPNTSNKGVIVAQSTATSAARVFLGRDTSGNATSAILGSGHIGALTDSPTEALDVNSDAIRIRTAQTPASAAAAGDAGMVCWDSSYIYVCVATNTWKRVAIATW